MKIERDLIAQFGKFIMAPLMMSLVQSITWLGHFTRLIYKTLLIQSITPMLTVLPMLAEQIIWTLNFQLVLTESIFIFQFAVVLL